MENFKCPICDSKDKWKNVDEFRFKKSGMSMCESCGFITYPDLCSKTTDMKEFYKHDYREAPSINNTYAGERKLHYHAEFLEPLFQEWKTAEFLEPNVLEIGAAFGMALKWVQNEFPKAHLFGTELTTSFRRNAWWLYHIKLDEEVDYTKKYDLIMSYKVAEHIPFIDEELRKNAMALSEKGRMYISVPTWFGELTSFGLTNFDLEYYYDTNHVNVWSRNHFEQLLKKVGLEVVQENHTYYNDTYLCKRNDAVMDMPRTYDDPAVRLKDLEKVLAATKAIMEQRFQEAIEIWPDFPDAHINAYEMQRSKVHQNGFDDINEKIIRKALTACPQSGLVSNFAADVCMRYERYEDALLHLKRSLELKPNDPCALTAMGHCYRNMAMRTPNEDDKIKLFHEARRVMAFIEKVSKQCAPDSITWMMQDNARIPTPSEKLG